MFRSVNFWVAALILTCAVGHHFKTKGWQPVRAVLVQSDDRDRQIAVTLARDIASWLPLHGQCPRMAVARIRGDRHMLLFEHLERCLPQRNVVLLTAPWYVDACYLTDLRQPPEGDRVIAHHGAQTADLILHVEVTHWEYLPETRVTAVARVIDRGSRAVVEEADFELNADAFATHSAQKPVIAGPAIDTRYVPLINRDNEADRSFQDILNTRLCGRFLAWCIGMLLCPLLMKRTVIPALADRAATQVVPLLIVYAAIAIPSAWWLWVSEVTFPEGTWFIGGTLAAGLLYWAKELKRILWNAEPANAT